MITSTVQQQLGNVDDQEYRRFRERLADHRWA